MSRIKKSFRLPPDLVDLARKIAKENHETVTHMVIEGLCLYMDRHYQNKLASRSGADN